MNLVKNQTFKDINNREYVFLTTSLETEEQRQVVVYYDKEKPNEILLVNKDKLDKIDLKNKFEFSTVRSRDLSLDTVYTHYKDKDYLSYYKAIDVENGTEYCVYQALYDDKGMFARPLDMFLGTVEYKGQEILRFVEKL